MPVFVDHDERRRQVVEVASRLIAEVGLEGVGVRDIASAAGCSTAIVSHYFHNKKELLFLTYEASIDRATERSVVALGPGGRNVRAYLAEIMPLDEERLIEWKIWVAFWAKAISDPEIAAKQRDCVRRTRGNILKVLQKLRAGGVLVDGLDLPQTARRLLVLIMGMAVQVLFDPEDWPTSRQRAFVDAELRALYRPEQVPADLRDRAAKPAIMASE